MQQEVEKRWSADQLMETNLMQYHLQNSLDKHHFKEAHGHDKTASCVKLQTNSVFNEIIHQKISINRLKLAEVEKILSNVTKQHRAMKR